MKNQSHLYVLIATIALACSGCHQPEARENELAKVTQEATTPTGSTMLQSTDGGLTWHDISQGLPDHEQPESFFAGESAIYVQVKNVMYHSKRDLKTPVWERWNVPDLKSRSSNGTTAALMAFNRSGVMAFSPDGQIYQQTSSGNWFPIYTNFKNQSMRTIFEASDGTLFIGCDNGLYQSADKGENWKLVQEGPAYAIVESGGVLMASRGTGIMRSTDRGEHWKGIIRDGRVGHFVEPIDGGFIVVSDAKINKTLKIRLSLDGGETWKTIDDGLPPSMSISSIKQMGKYLICGHPDGIFRSSDMGKTWTRVHPAVEESIDTNLFLEASAKRVSVPSKEVFTIYTSGNTLYAVAKIPGC